MRKIGLIIATVAVIGMVWAGFAHAHQDDITNTNTATGGNATGGQGGRGGDGGQAISVSGASSNSRSRSESTAVSVSGSRSRSNATGGAASADGTVDNTVNVDNSQGYNRYAPSVAAPALTAAGTGVCLGSVSIGLSGPMAGASFGITKVDKGCERRSGAALLFQMGYKDEAIHLLLNDPEIRAAFDNKPGYPSNLPHPQPTPTKGAAANLDTFEPVSKDTTIEPQSN